MQQTIKELTPATITWNAENRATTANQEVKFDLSGHVIIHEADRFELKLTIASNLENNQRLDYKNGLVVPVRDWLRPELEAVGISFDPEDACGHQNNYVFTRLVTAMRNEKTKFPAEFKFNMWKTPEQKTTTTEEESPEMRFTLTPTLDQVVVIGSHPTLGEQPVVIKHGYKFTLCSAKNTEGEPLDRLTDVLATTVESFASSLGGFNTYTTTPVQQYMGGLVEFCNSLIEEMENRPEFDIFLELDDATGDVHNVMIGVDDQERVQVLQVKFSLPTDVASPTSIPAQLRRVPRGVFINRPPIVPMSSNEPSPADNLSMFSMQDKNTRGNQSFGQAAERFHEKQGNKYYVSFMSSPGLFRFFDHRSGRLPTNCQPLGVDEIGDMIHGMAVGFMGAIGNNNQLVISQDAVASASNSMVEAVLGKNGTVECYFEVLGNGLVLNVGDDYVVIGKVTSPTKTTTAEVDIKISNGAIAKIEVSLGGFGLAVASVGNGNMLEFITDHAANSGLDGVGFDEIMHVLTSNIITESQLGEMLMVGLRQLGDMVTRRKYATRWFVTAKGEVIIDN